MADRYTYLSYIGIAFILSSIVVSVSGKLRYIFLALAGVFIIALMTITLRQTEVWQNTETLWTRVIERYPNTVIARGSRGKYYSKLVLEMKPGERRANYIEKALADFRVAMKAGSKSTDVYEGAGYLYGLKGEYETALQHLNIAIMLDKKKGSAYYNRAIVLAAMNRKEEAIRDYNSALLFRSEKAVEIITNRSNLYLDLGRYREAIPDFDFLISVDPGNFLFWFNRGLSKHATGDTAGAIKDYRQALVINPGDEMTRSLLSKLTDSSR
jgi:tetratricopeptide (TPR) repeat protein